MSAKNCLVIIHLTQGEPVVVSDPKDTYFSKKNAQRKADAMLKELGPGALRAEVVEQVLVVNHHV